MHLQKYMFCNEIRWPILLILIYMIWRVHAQNYKILRSFIDVLCDDKMNDFLTIRDNSVYNHLICEQLDFKTYDVLFITFWNHFDEPVCICMVDIHNCAHADGQIHTQTHENNRHENNGCQVALEEMPSIYLEHTHLPLLHCKVI